MPYTLSGVTIRTNHTPEGMEKIGELWRDVTSGKLPILFDSEGQFLRGISPISVYHNYAAEETGDYDLSILGVTADFFEEMEQKVCRGFYKKYEVCGEEDQLEACTKRAWELVWAQQRSGELQRAFTRDYESTVPAAYTKDKRAHCYLYIACEQSGSSKAAFPAEK